MATQTEVARHLSLTDRQLRRLQKLPGAPISNKRGQLDLDAWRDFYISYLRRSKNDVPDGDSEDDYEEKLLIARWELTAEQAVTQQLKNEVSKGKLIDTGFCIFALSKLAMALSSTLDSIPLSSTLDSIPLSMQRQFPDLTPRHLDHLKTLIAKGANQCARAGDKLPDLLDEYIRATTE
ncbi:terminase [Escherichia coli]|nr:terminase [Escherichia coli]